MRQDAGKRLDKAARAIRAARELLASGDADFAASRAYYAMFYVADALLAERELRFSKHGAVHSAFGQHFAKPGLLDASFHRWLLDAFDKRNAADYGVDVVIEVNEAAEMVDHAEEFLRAAREHLEKGQ